MEAPALADALIVVGAAPTLVNRASKATARDDDGKCILESSKKKPPGQEFANYCKMRERGQPSFDKLSPRKTGAVCNLYIRKWQKPPGDKATEGTSTLRAHRTVVSSPRQTVRVRSQWKVSTTPRVNDGVSREPRKPSGSLPIMVADDSGDD